MLFLIGLFVLLEAQTVFVHFSRPDCQLSESGGKACKKPLLRISVSFRMFWKTNWDFSGLTSRQQQRWVFGGYEGTILSILVLFVRVTRVLRPAATADQRALAAALLELSLLPATLENIAQQSRGSSWRDVAAENLAWAVHAG